MNSLKIGSAKKIMIRTIYYNRVLLTCVPVPTYVYVTCRSVLRDKTVVQQAIRTLKEEVTTLKETNKELQSKILLVSLHTCWSHS